MGRWGNYFNQELFGGPTTLPWGLQVDEVHVPAGFSADTLFHPTFLYESLWNVVGVVILLALDRKFSFRRGRLFMLYAMYYTLGRVWIEAMRIDDAEQISLFGITTRLNVWTSIAVFLAALVIFILVGLRGRPVPDSVYLSGREPEPSATSASAPDAAVPVAAGSAPAAAEAAPESRSIHRQAESAPENVGDDSSETGQLRDPGTVDTKDPKRP